MVFLDANDNHKSLRDSRMGEGLTNHVAFVQLLIAVCTIGVVYILTREANEEASGIFRSLSGDSRLPRASVRNVRMCTHMFATIRFSCMVYERIFVRAALYAAELRRNLHKRFGLKVARLGEKD